MATEVNNRFIWLNGQILNVNDAKINVLSPTAQFGLNVFEGIRCYWNDQKKQLYAFRLEDHYRRLERSARLLQLDCPYTVADMQQALTDVVKTNEYKEDLTVRQTLFADGFGSWTTRMEVGMFVAPIPKRNTSAEYNKAGLRCCVSSWERINDNSLSPRIKCGANYINSRMAQLEALRNGYDTTLFLTNQGKVAEGPGSCLFLVRDGMLITPPITDSVLESITRDTILKLAAQLGIPAVERSVDRTELYLCDEAFLCGSSMGITPITAIDGYEVPAQGEDAVTRRLSNAYHRIVRGDDDDWNHWLTPIW
ncbi:MAG: branched-chain amino acid transaminase [Clostridiales bacterium]|nr:branched-chain amino acid transaminase [Clostridiales bacterium]